MPLTEVADALGIPVGTARSRLHYALKTGNSDPAAEPQTNLDVVDDLAAGLGAADVPPPYMLVGSQQTSQASNSPRPNPSSVSPDPSTPATCVTANTKTRSRNSSRFVA